MPTSFESLVRRNLPIGQAVDVFTVDALTKEIIAQVSLINPDGGNPGQLNYLWACCPGPEGKIFFSINNGATGAAIMEISSESTASQNVRLVAGLPGTAGTTNGTGTAARFGTYIKGMAYANGKLYICDTFNYKIRVMDTTTYAVTDFAGSGSNAQTDGTGVLAAFLATNCICVDSGGANLYVGQFNASGSSSFRKVTIPGAVVTTPTGQTHATINTQTDAICISNDDAYLFYTDREQTSAATSYLYRYTLATSTRVEITDSAGNSGTDQTPAGIFALGATTASVVKFGPSGYTSLAPDPTDPAVVYFFDNANTASSSASSRIHKIKLLGPYATPTHFSIYPFAGAGGAASDTQGLGIAGPGFSTSQAFLSPQPLGKQLLFADGVASNLGKLWTIDTEDAFVSLIAKGVANANLEFNSNSGHDAYVSWGIRPAAEAENAIWMRHVSRLPLAPGETILEDLKEIAEDGDVIFATAHNAMATIVVNSLRDS